MKTYSVMQPKRPQRKPGDSDENFNWITDPEPEKHLCGVIHKLIQQQQGRLWLNTRLMSLYANEDLTASTQAGRRASTMPSQTMNLAKVYGDTLAGKLTQSNSKVTTLTAGGDWTTFRLARKVDMALEAEFRRSRLYEEASKVALDAINTGTGYLYVYQDYDANRVCVERWYPNEIFMDPLDSAYGDPTVMFRRRYIKRENALAWWGEDAEKARIIERAGSSTGPSFGWTYYEPGMIELFEAWALPVGNRRGRHVLCLNSGALVDERWESETFPVAVFRGGERTLGWYGDSLLKHAAGAQIQLNRILTIMAKSAELGIAPYWVLSAGSDIAPKQIANIPGHILSTTGEPPKWVTNPPFHQAAAGYVEILERSISTIYGINDIEASASKGFNRVDSDPALTTMQDMWMARHQIILKNWSEFFFLDAAERVMSEARKIAQRKGTYPVQAYKGGRSELLDFADFKVLDDTQYSLQMAPMSYLPSTPAAKFQRITQMKAEGLISPQRALQLLAGPPDLEAVTAEVSAVENDGDRVIEALMDGEVPDIHAAQVLEEIIPRIRAANLIALDRNAPDHVLGAFDRWLTAAAMEQQKSMMPAPAGPTEGLASGSFGPTGIGLGGGAAGAIPSGPGGPALPAAPIGPPAA